jgi:hypothetical protein
MLSRAGGYTPDSPGPLSAGVHYIKAVQPPALLHSPSQQRITREPSTAFVALGEQRAAGQHHKGPSLQIMHCGTPMLCTALHLPRNPLPGA